MVPQLCYTLRQSILKHRTDLLVGVEQDRHQEIEQGTGYFALVIGTGTLGTGTDILAGKNREMFFIP